MCKGYGFMENLTYLYLLSCMNFVNCIIGGHYIERERWGILVQIAYESEIPFCSGTIIMPSWILTAGRCLHKSHIGTSQILGINLGIATIGVDPGKLVKKELIYIHPFFMTDPNSGVSVNDIAIMMLEQSIGYGKDIHPVGLGIEMVDSDNLCMTAGWGATNEAIYTDLNVHNPNYYPSKGQNHIKEIDVLTSEVTVCQNLLKSDYQDAIDKEFHGCSTSPEPKTTTKRYKRETNRSMPFILGYTRNINRTKRDAIVDQVYEKKDSSDSFWGPSFGDLGGPLLCADQQVGIFAFSVVENSRRPTKVAAAWTRLDRHIKWMDNTIEGAMKPKMSRANPRVNTEPANIDIWDELSAAQCISVFYFTIGLTVLFLFLL